YIRPARLLRQLGNPVITNAARGGVMAAPAEPQVSAVVTILTNLGSKVPSSETEVANLKTDLIRAGYRSEKALPVFYGIRILSTLFMMIMSLMVQAKMPSNPAMSVALIVFGCAAGWVFPRMFLEK